jgi:hypothetical protein
MIQTRFDDNYNTDKTTPTIGWDTFVKVNLYTTDGTVISTGVTTVASRYLVGYDGSNSYQLIEIDMALVSALVGAVTPSTDCFVLEFESYVTGDVLEQTVQTEYFKIIDPDCDETILVKGTYPNLDCYTNYYGEPETGAYVGSELFQYDNTRRYDAYIRDTGGSIEKTVFSNVGTRKVQATDIVDRFSFILTELIPPFIKNQLLYVHMAGDAFIADGKTYYTDSTDITNENAESNMFLFSAEVTTTCTNRSFSSTSGSTGC